MKFKKILSFAAVGLLSLSLAACGSNSDAANVPEEEPEATEAVSENVAEAEAVEAGDKEFTIVATNFDLESDNELIVRKGDNVKLHLENEEGVHGIEIKEFGVSGGGGETIEFVASEVGTFKVLCSIMCGAGHADMEITLTVVE